MSIIVHSVSLTNSI